MKPKSIRLYSRAALLLMILLTTVTAWAETKTVSYIDADGTQKSVTATILTGNETPNSSESINSTTPTPVESSDHTVTFVGQYSPFKIGDVSGGDDGNLNEIILMSSGNKLGYSKNPRTLKCFRCHFYVPANSGEVLARSFVLDFGDNEQTTEINEELRMKNEESAGAWYTLDGRKLDGEPTTKGMYINGNRKVVIK